MTIDSKRAAAFVLGSALVGVLGQGHAALAAGRPNVPDFMATLGFSSKEVADLLGGAVVSKVLDTKMVGANDMAEVAVMGAVRVDVPRQAFIDAVKDVKGFRGSVHQTIGFIHVPPQASDFASMALPPDDVQDLKACRPGKCALKLAGPGLADLQAKIDWKAANAGEQVNAFARQRLLQVVTAYTVQGTSAFLPLEDKSTAINIDEQFRQLLKNTPKLISFYPELADYLVNYPKTKLASSNEVLYWAKNDFGLKPTVIVMHAVGYVPPGTQDAVVAWKQIYASHYFNASLGVTTYAVDGNASYLLQLDRLRADSLGGAFGGVKRGKMSGAMDGALKKFLEGARADLKKRAGK